MATPADDPAAAALRLDVERALDASLRQDEPREQEPYFSAVLDALQEQPGLRPFAVKLFCELLHTRRPRRPVEDVLAYCMHSLRWPEVRQYVERLNVPEDSEDWRRMSLAYEDILIAYRDDWRWRNLYARYTDRDRAGG